MRRIQSSNQLRENNTYHLAAAARGCSTPSSGQAGAPQAERSSIPEALYPFKSVGGMEGVGEEPGGGATGAVGEGGGAMESF